MDDVTRLFRFVVARIAREDPARLHQPLQVSEIYQRWAPYGTYKVELGFDTIDDYDMALLQLFAGAHGHVTLDPTDARDALAAELEAVDPDPGAFRSFAAARVVLASAAVRATLDGDSTFEPPPPPVAIVPDDAPLAPAVDGAPREDAESDDRWAPPEPEEPPPAAPPPAAAPPTPFEPVVDRPLCPQCRAALPGDRAANFCPHCGTVLGPRRCVHCGDPIEDGWSFCLTCGSTLRR